MYVLIEWRTIGTNSLATPDKVVNQETTVSRETFVNLQMQPHLVLCLFMLIFGWAGVGNVFISALPIPADGGG